MVVGAHEHGVAAAGDLRGHFQPRHARHFDVQERDIGAQTTDRPCPVRRAGDKSMKKPTAIIADDEAPLRAYLRRRLAEVWPELRLCGEAANGAEALRLIREHAPPSVPAGKPAVSSR